MSASAGTNRGVQAPRLGDLRRLARAADGLDEGDPATLAVDAYRDNERFFGLDLTGRRLSGLTLSECALVDVTVTDADLRAVRITDTPLTRLNAPVLRAPHSVWRDASVEHSRIGSGELYDAELNTVLIGQSKIGFLNLRGSVLRDVMFEDCTVDELDLSEASAARLAFPGCTIAMLDVSRARLENVDLRGARIYGIRGIDSLHGVTVDSAQLMDLAPLLAAHLGIRID
jgi:uncharacterized protein YjbI with pentapeptide repeats